MKELQIDCHDHLTNRDREFLFELVREVLADQGVIDPETIGFTLTAFCTTHLIETTSDH